MATLLSNGQQSVMATSNGQEQQQQDEPEQQQVEIRKSSSPKPGAMPNLKLNRMGSVSPKDKRVYKIVLTGGEFWGAPFQKYPYISDRLLLCICYKCPRIIVSSWPIHPIAICLRFVSRSRISTKG